MFRLDVCKNGSSRFLELNKRIEHCAHENAPRNISTFLSAVDRTVDYLLFVLKSFPHSILIIDVQKICLHPTVCYRWRKIGMTFNILNSAFWVSNAAALKIAVSHSWRPTFLASSYNAHSFINAIQCSFVGMNTMECVSAMCMWMGRELLLNFQIEHLVVFPLPFLHIPSVFAFCSPRFDALNSDMKMIWLPAIILLQLFRFHLSHSSNSKSKFPLDYPVRNSFQKFPFQRSVNDGSDNSNDDNEIHTIAYSF